MAKQINVKVPPDVLDDLRAVCPDGERIRNRFIVEAIREKLATEEAAQRAREEREAQEDWERRVAEARLRAEAIGAALHWDIKRIETFIALGPSDADGLLVRELLTMQQERSADDSGDEK